MKKLLWRIKRRNPLFYPRRERFRNEFLRRIVPWEKISLSWDTFPYFIHEHSKKFLVECAASHLKNKKFTTAYGWRLSSSSGRILLQNIVGTELYQERLVRALARDLQVPLLVLDSSILAPYDSTEDCSSENESDVDNPESVVECTSESEIDDENEASNEEDCAGGDGRTDDSDDEVDVQATAEALKKLVRYNLEEIKRSVSGEVESSSASSKSEADEPSDQANRSLKKGDRVNYIGPSISIEANEKWFGDAEKLTRALFSFASKLAPVIIFIDEVDSLLGARTRGGSFDHEATRRMRNEFMAAWDGLRSKDSQRILILVATNRHFDFDDAVIRRLPRRIYVDLPDAENRLKILKIILARENLKSGFSFDQLANATEGYSGSDLKNLCIAAAYRPVQELLEEEIKGHRLDEIAVLRQLNLHDFVHSKAKVGPSVACDAASMNELRKWNDRYGE